MDKKQVEKETKKEIEKEEEEKEEEENLKKDSSTNLQWSSSSKMISLSEKFWQNDKSVVNHDSISPVESPRCILHKFDPTFAFIFTFANVSLLETSEGIVMIDTGHDSYASVIKKEVRKFSNKPVHTCIYTHHHVDHVMGILCFEELNKVFLLFFFFPFFFFSFFLCLCTLS